MSDCETATRITRKAPASLICIMQMMRTNPSNPPENLENPNREPRTQNPQGTTISKRYTKCILFILSYFCKALPHYY